MSENNDFLTVCQAAKILGLHHQTLRNWDRSGKLVAHRWTEKRIRMYSREQLQNYLKGLEAELSDRREKLI